MLKKMTSALLIMAFTNVYAATPMQSQLEQSFDSFNYKINVEWNQKDETFFNQAITDFETEIRTLQEEGLTKNELMKYTFDKIKDKEVKDEINEIATVINESQMSDEEARAFTISKLNSTYAQGASWFGRNKGSYASLLLGAIIFIWIFTAPVDSNPNNGNYDPGYYCYTTYPSYPTYGYPYPSYPTYICY